VKGLFSRFEFNSVIVRFENDADSNAATKLDFIQVSLLTLRYILYNLIFV
jgi:hypothetical protein